MTEYKECPICSYRIDAHTPTKEADDGIYEPRPGDLSICFKCGNLNKFDGSMNLVVFNDEDKERMENEDPETLKEALRIALKVRDRNRNVN